MNIKICNRCKKPLKNERFSVTFALYGDYGNCMSNHDYDSPEIQLNDFHFCTDCMKDFIEFVKEN